MDSYSFFQTSLSMIVVDSGRFYGFDFCLSLYVGGPWLVHSGTWASEMESALGMYGLMSIIGESSRASSPSTVRRQSSTLISFATHKPMGFGLEGLLQAKTPTFTSALCLFGITCNTLLSFLLSRR